MGTADGVIAIVGLTVLSVVTRGFFFLGEREIPIPDWLRQGLRYAPLAALVGVVLPEIVLLQGGQLIQTWQDARLYAAVAGAAYFWWRRDILGTIVSGMAVLLPLKLGLGW